MTACNPDWYDYGFWISMSLLSISTTITLYTFICSITHPNQKNLQSLILFFTFLDGLRFWIEFFFNGSILDNTSWPLSEPLQLVLGFISFLHYSLVLLFYARTWYIFRDHRASAFVTNNIIRIYILIILILFISYMTIGLYFVLRLSNYFTLFANITLVISLGLFILVGFYYIGGVTFRIIELNFDEYTFAIIRKTRTTAIVFLFLYIAVIILVILNLCTVTFITDNKTILSLNDYNSLCDLHLGRLMLLNIIPLLCTAYTFYPTRQSDPKIFFKEVSYDPIPASAATQEETTT